MWDAAVYIGTDAFGFAGSAYAALLLILNLSIQATHPNCGNHGKRCLAANEKYHARLEEGGDCLNTAIFVVIVWSIVMSPQFDARSAEGF
ncbi:hypothetical protein T484DRAFT_1799706 [Baffinella frigidus]|nr:hypothetical protein T484DRAFT_1799706 [Cryptophyta sp. CCMP2293]